MSARMLHLADLHLGARCEQWGDRAEERRDDLERAFVRAIDQALDDQAPAHAVAIAGDLFDSHRPSARLVSFAKGQLERLTEADITVVMVPGTHDSLEYPDSILRGTMPSGVHVFATPNVGAPYSVTVGGELVHFYGMAYLPTRSKAPFDAFRRTTDDGYHVAVLHGSLEGSPVWRVKERYLPLSLDRLGATGMHYVALGHYHEFRSAETNGVKVVYPGTLEGLKFTESGNRYLTWVELENGQAHVRHMTEQFQPMNSKVLDVRTMDLSLCSATDHEDLATRIKQWADPRLALQLCLKGTAEFHIDPHALAARLDASFGLLKIDDDDVS